MISTLTAFFCFLSTSTKIKKEILVPLRFDLSKALHLTSKNSYKYLTCLHLYKTTYRVPKHTFAHDFEVSLSNYFNKVCAWKRKGDSGCEPDKN